MKPDDPTARHFLHRSARVLRDDLLPKIREAVERLSDHEVWEREGSASNSVGNLLLHLKATCGST